MQRGIGQQLVGNVLITAALRFGDRPAFFCSATERRFGFRQVNRRCNQLAHALHGLGLAKGDTVALLCTNRVEVVETLFALAKTGIVGLPLNYRLAPGEIVDLMRTLGARALISEADFDTVAERAAQELPTLQHRIRISSGGSSPANGPVWDYEGLLAAAPETEPEVALDESDVFYFNLTSGTSGLPKCYALTQYNNATVMPMFTAMEVSSHDVVMTVFPMFGRVGYCWALCGLVHGIPNVLANFDPGRVLGLIESERVTITNLVPTMGAMLLDHGALGAHDLSSLRATVFAGASLPEPIRQGMVERICPQLYEYYGMQETGTLVVSTPEDRQCRPDAVGRAILHAEVRVVDDEGRVLPPGQVGEIIGRAPTGVTAYHDNPAKTAETFRSGWIHTGDLGTLDEEGHLFIRGRKKDMIVTGGQNVFAAEVEQAILALEDVRDCAVIGLPDPLWGERVSAVVVVNAGSTLGAEAVVRHCRLNLAAFKTPKQVILQQEPLPRTPTGKVQKFLLVARHGTGTLDDGAPAID